MDTQKIDNVHVKYDYILSKFVIQKITIGTMHIVPLTIFSL
jgi:hypothetical protein